MKGVLITTIVAILCLVGIAWGAYALVDPLAANRLRFGFAPEEERERLARKDLWAVRASAIPIMIIASYILGWFR